MIRTQTNGTADESGDQFPAGEGVQNVTSPFV